MRRGSHYIYLQAGVDWVSGEANTPAPHLLRPKDGLPPALYRARSEEKERGLATSPTQS